MAAMGRSDGPRKSGSSRGAPRAMIRVLLVDDHALVRTGFRSILQAAPDVEVVDEASSGEEALAKVSGARPDLVLMDVSMPGIGGIEATRRIRRFHPDVQVIAVTVRRDDPFPTQLQEAGALGYVSKGCGAEEMLEAIRTVAEGKPFVSSDVAKRLALAGFQHKSRQTGGDPFALLSKRELQVTLMIVRGHRNQDIADSLCLSPKTISTYRQRIFEKLGVDNDVELTHLAMRYGLLGPED